jgi:hypothetical protein
VAPPGTRAGGVARWTAGRYPDGTVCALLQTTTWTIGGARTVAREGAKNLAEFCTAVETIQDVVDRLTAIRDASAEDLRQPEIDGISCFSRLCCTITQNILETVEGKREKRKFRGPHFLTLLDLEFARRYLAAIQKYATGVADVPRCWAVLFDHRDEQTVKHPNFAAGVNAHVNFDLTFALLETWKSYPPTEDRRHD